MMRIKTVYNLADRNPQDKFDNFIDMVKEQEELKHGYRVWLINKRARNDR